MHTGLMRRELRKLAGSPDASHRTHPERPVLTGLMRREVCKTTSHRTHTTGRSKLRPVPIIRCLTLTESGCLLTGRTGTASGASESASGECSSARKHSRYFSKFPTGAIENMQFIFLKSAESRLASSAGGREEPILSLPFKLHLLLKVCQHHNV